MFSQRRSHYWSQQSRTFFFKGFSAKQQKKPKKAANYSVIEQNALSDKHPKMTGQNDRPDENLTGQPHDQAGHCSLTGRYFEPWLLVGLLGRLSCAHDRDTHSIKCIYTTYKTDRNYWQWVLTLLQQMDSEHEYENLVPWVPLWGSE